MPDHAAQTLPEDKRGSWALLTVALGANLWLLGGPVPWLADPPKLTDVDAFRLAVAATSSLVALGLLCASLIGRSPVLLLAVTPLVALLPLGLLSGGVDPPLAAPPLPLLIVSLVAFLLTGLRFVAAQPSQPSAVRQLGTGVVDGKWQRRNRVYGLFAATAALAPLALIATARLATPRRAVFTVASAVLALSVVQVGLLSPLGRHLAGDPSLLTASRRPRPAFFVWVCIALIAIGVLLGWRR
jgi:hypothetical protein